MMRPFLPAFMFTLCLHAPPAAADSLQWAAELEGCLGESVSVDEMRLCKQAVFFACKSEAGDAPGSDATCQAADAVVWDERLNLLWKQVKANAGELGVGETLLASQRAWLSYRDASCAHEVALTRATLGDELWTEQYCLADLTAERVFALYLMLAQG